MAAKGLFYSVGDAAKRLGKSVSEVQEMVRRGELSEFRNENNELQLRREQVDLLAGDEDGIPLSDSAAGGSGLGLADTGGSMASRTGISVFDMDDAAEEADPSAQTQVTAGGAGLNLESFGSGSGLLDLTRESDETSLGAEGLLDELYSTGEQAAPSGVGGGPLFEGAASAGEVSGFGAAPAMGFGVVATAEPFDGKGSGLTGGLMLGATLCLLVGLGAVLMGMLDALPQQLVDMNMMIVFGAMAGVTLIFGVIGFVVSKK